MLHNERQGPLTTIEEVRSALAGALGHPVREDVFLYLVKKNYVKEVIDYPRVFKDLVKEYGELDANFLPVKQRGGRETPKNLPPDDRLLALAEIASIQAGNLPAVIAFREEILSGRMLSPSEMQAWMDAQAKEDGAATTRVKVQLPQGVEIDREQALDWVKGWLELSSEEKRLWPIGFEVEFLAYPSVDGAVTCNVPVNLNGVLGRLKGLVKSLTTEYPWWQEAQATAFVLTGRMPLLPKAAGKTVYHSNAPPRVILDLDPRLSSVEAAGFYAKIRRDVFSGRDKPMTKKHLQLAIFLAGKGDQTWDQMRRCWNQENPNWPYDDYRMFARDSKAAWRRVTGQKWIGGNGAQ